MKKKESSHGVWDISGNWYDKALAVLAGVAGYSLGAVMDIIWVRGAHARGPTRALAWGYTSLVEQCGREVW